MNEDLILLPAVCNRALKTVKKLKNVTMKSEDWRELEPIQEDLYLEISLIKSLVNGVKGDLENGKIL